MNELKVNPKWAPKVEDPKEFRSLSGVEFSHVAVDVCDDKLFFRTLNFTGGSSRDLQMNIEVYGKSVHGIVQFTPAVGREIGQAILDLCKEEE